MAMLTSRVAIVVLGDGEWILSVGEGGRFGPQVVGGGGHSVWAVREEGKLPEAAWARRRGPRPAANRRTARAGKEVGCGLSWRDEA